MGDCLRQFGNDRPASALPLLFLIFVILILIPSSLGLGRSTFDVQPRAVGRPPTGRTEDEDEENDEEEKASRASRCPQREV